MCEAGGNTPPALFLFSDWSVPFPTSGTGRRFNPVARRRPPPSGGRRSRPAPPPRSRREAAARTRPACASRWHAPARLPSSRPPRSTGRNSTSPRPTARKRRPACDAASMVRFGSKSDRRSSRLECPSWVMSRPSAPSETPSAFRPKRDLRRRASATFGPERRQVGDGLFVHRPQRPPESGPAFSGCRVARNRDGRLWGACATMPSRPIQ